MVADVSSGLENTTPYDVPHFTIKSEIEKEIQEAGLPATFVHPGFYLQNFEGFFPPSKTDGTAH